MKMVLNDGTTVSLVRLVQTSDYVRWGRSPPQPVEALVEAAKNELPHSWGTAPISLLNMGAEELRERLDQRAMPRVLCIGAFDAYKVFQDREPQLAPSRQLVWLQDAFEPILSGPNHDALICTHWADMPELGPGGSPARGWARVFSTFVPRS